MEVISNLRIVKSIFEEKLPNEKFDIVELFLFSRPRNRKIFYIGKNDIGNYTLFKHSISDRVYYDILNGNKMYDNSVMKKVKCLDNLVKKEKERSDNNDN